MMQKKFAYVLMSSPAENGNRVVITESPNMLQIVARASGVENACTLAKQLYEEGFGVIELCGAFGADGAQTIKNFAGEGLGVAYVTRLPGQDDLFNAFFQK